MTEGLSIFGHVEPYQPGDEKQSAKQYYCIRKECGQPIKIIAFNEANSHCSVNCQKLDSGELTEEDLKHYGHLS